MPGLFKVLFAQCAEAAQGPESYVRQLVPPNCLSAAHGSLREGLGQLHANKWLRLLIPPFLRKFLV